MPYLTTASLAGGETSSQRLNVTVTSINAWWHLEKEAIHDGLQQ